MFAVDGVLSPLRNLWQSTGLSGQQLASSALGVDIGQFETKIAWLHRTGADGYRIALAKLPTFPKQLNQADDPDSKSADDRRSHSSNPFKVRNAFDAGSSILWDNKELESLSHRVLRALGTRELKRSDMLINLSMAVCDVRSLCIPRDTARSDIAIQGLLNESIGEPQPRNIALLPAENDEKAKVRVFSISEALTSGVSKLFERNSLHPCQIDGLPWSQGRLAQMAVQDPNHLVLVLDWGYSRPTLTVVKDGEIKYVRRLSVGGLNQIMSQPLVDLHMTHAEAARWVKHCLSPKCSDGPLVQDTQVWAKDCCKKLAKEIAAARDYVQWRYKGEEISSLVLIGGGASCERLVNELNGAVNLPMMSWRSKVGDETVTPEYATATSLAMLGVSRAR
ncbi:MAG: hypothetical protein ACE361_18150 [Aureliella sp.]